jgi:hypothetical protein
MISIHFFRNVQKSGSIEACFLLDNIRKSVVIDIPETMYPVTKKDVVTHTLSVTCNRNL